MATGNYKHAVHQHAKSFHDRPAKELDVCFKLPMKTKTCSECDMEFSRKDAMLGHKGNKHGTTHPYPRSSDAYPPSSQSYPPPPPQVVLQHPLTLMAIGPTYSGKSCWMNGLLIHAKTIINPKPERIIWC